jgi:hypothetical protein
MSQQLSPEQRKRLNELAEEMKTAKGKALDRICAEVDRIIGHEYTERDREAEKKASALWKKGDDHGS